MTRRISKEREITDAILAGLSYKDDEEKFTKHGRGKVCSECGKKKDTKKIGNRFLCLDCKKEQE